MKLSSLVATMVAAFIGFADAAEMPPVPRVKVTYSMAPVAPRSGNPFNVMALRSASPIHFGQISASQSSIFINLRNQNAKCEGKDPNKATFHLTDEQLYLYTATGPVQRVFVDRSGFGQGKLGYLTGNVSVPPRFELKGWKFRRVGTHQKTWGWSLYFGDKNLIACPGSVDNSWSVWVMTDNLRPGGNEGCMGFTPLVLEPPNPSRCEYGQ